jgi:hypothetical protein
MYPIKTKTKNFKNIKHDMYKSFNVMKNTRNGFKFLTVHNTQYSREQ